MNFERKKNRLSDFFSNMEISFIPNICEFIYDYS